MAQTVATYLLLAGSAQPLIIRIVSLSLAHLRRKAIVLRAACLGRDVQRVLRSHLLQELEVAVVVPGGQDFWGAWTASAEWSLAGQLQEPRSCNVAVTVPPPPPHQPNSSSITKEDSKVTTNNDLHASSFWQADKWLEGGDAARFSAPDGAGLETAP